MTYQRVPPVPSGYSNAYHIFQSPGQVVILNEMIHDVRVIPLDGRAPIDGRIRQWNGDGRGRWEGDTLVVETTHYRDDTTWRGFPGTRDLRAVERFTRIDEDTIDYRYTIHDEATYTRPFTVQLPLKQPAGLRHLRIRLPRGELLDRQRAGRRAGAGGGRTEIAIAQKAAARWWRLLHLIFEPGESDIGYELQR